MTEEKQVKTGLNREWIRTQLWEAKEELDGTLAKIVTDEEYDEGEFKIAMDHIYTHLNVAWNERNARIVGNADAWLFPEDIAKELRAQVRHIKRKEKAWRLRKDE
ncbi:MAG: hypothetical protein J7J46_09885 [Candidatus Desulfofervidus sp.]|nr:hypothetical protein [Candidatus Desulfofervidus sp.]